MKLKLTPTQNLCVGFLESGFKVIRIKDNYYFVKGDRQQKVLSKTLDALIDRGAAYYDDNGNYQLSNEFVEHRKRLRTVSPRKSMIKKAGNQQLH